MAAATKKDEPGARFVTAPLVVVTTKGGSVKQMYRGDLITEDVSAESAELLKSLGFISEGNPLDSTEK